MKSTLEMLYHWEETRGNKVFLRQPIDGQLHTWTWKETADEVRRMAAALQAKGYPKGSRIAMLSKNCAHWVMADLATMMAGYTGVPMYPNQDAESVKYILEHSEAVAIFIGKLDTWEEMKPGVSEGLDKIAFPFYGHDEYEAWDLLTSEHEPIKENIVRNPDDMASIIYTSGTTGRPKGVVHSFNNFTYASSKAIGHIDCSPKDRFFSYLPLCHIAERLLVEHGGIYSGGSIDFAQSLDTFADNLRAAKPTIFLGVPRIWSKFQQGVLAKQPQKKLDTLLKIPIISGIIKKKVKEALGLQEGRMLMTGAAPIPVATINWYKKLGIELLEAYAMTENTCYSHVTMPDKVQVGSVGQALPDCDCRIGEEDEIQIKHDALMIEYYKDPEQTKEAFTSDGYLRTGDSGSIDSQGFLRITGRVKDIFKTDKGKYISPAQIELKLSANTNIGQVCLVGTGIPQPIALVTLSEIGQKVSKEEVSKSLVETVKALNKTLGKHEIIKSVVCLPEEWTVENTCLTPTMKIKRKNVEAKHKDNYIKWYEDENFVVFPG